MAATTIIVVFAWLVVGDTNEGDGGRSVCPDGDAPAALPEERREDEGSKTGGVVARRVVQVVVTVIEMDADDPIALDRVTECVTNSLCEDSTCHRRPEGRVGGVGVVQGYVAGIFRTVVRGLNWCAWIINWTFETAMQTTYFVLERMVSLVREAVSWVFAGGERRVATVALLCGLVTLSLMALSHFMYRNRRHDAETLQHVEGRRDVEGVIPQQQATLRRAPRGGGELFADGDGW